MAYNAPGSNHFCAQGPPGMNGHNSPFAVRMTCYNPPFIPNTTLSGMTVDTTHNCIGAYANRSNCYFNSECASGECLQGTCAPFNNDIRNSGKNMRNYRENNEAWTRDNNRDTIGNINTIGAFQKGSDDYKRFGRIPPKKLVVTDSDEESSYSESAAAAAACSALNRTALQGNDLLPKTVSNTRRNADRNQPTYKIIDVPVQLIPRCQQCYQYAFDSRNVVEPPVSLGPSGDYVRNKMKQCFVYDAELPNGMTSAIAVRWDDPFCRGVYDALSEKCRQKCSYS